MDLQLLIRKSLFFQYWHLVCIAIVTVILINWAYRKNILWNWVHRAEAKNKKMADFVYAEEEKNNENGKSKVNKEYTPSLEDKEHIRYKGATITLPGGAQQFYEITQNRRSVRAFKSQPIPSINIIQTCIRAAGTAPSGAHTEPWTFCVIASSDLKQRIRQIIEFEEELNYTQRMSRQWTADLRPLKTNHIKPYLTEAPYLIAVFKQIYSFTNHGKRKQHYYNEISVSISIGILLCALQTAGLSSLVTTPLNCGPSLRDVLNRPSNEKLLALLPVGYPVDDCMVPDLHRKHLNEIMLMY